MNRSRCILSSIMLGAILILLGHSFLPHAHEPDVAPAIRNNTSYHIHFSLFGLVERILSQDHGAGHLEHFQRGGEVELQDVFSVVSPIPLDCLLIELASVEVESPLYYPAKDLLPPYFTSINLPQSGFRGPPVS